MYSWAISSAANQTRPSSPWRVALRSISRAALLTRASSGTQTQLADFVKIRKTFSYGPTRDYWDNAQVIGWVREGDSVHEGCAVVMSIGTGDSWKRMQLPDGHAGEKWIDALGWYEGEVTIGDDGWADFHCHPRSVSCWVKKDKRDLEAFSNLKISD